MPLGLSDRSQIEPGDDLVEKRTQRIQAAKRVRTAPLRVDNALCPIHNWNRCYCCACPHSGQNLLTFGTDLPQFRQNFVSALAGLADGSPLGAAVFLSESAMA